MMRAHMIVDSETSYTWIEGNSTGFKMELNTAPQGDQPAQGVNVDEQLDYRCRTWSTDSALFNLPDNVEFKDFSAILPPAVNLGSDAKVPTAGSNDSVTGANAQQCAACDSVPEPTRSQCRAALGCR